MPRRSSRTGPTRARTSSDRKRECRRRPTTRSRTRSSPSSDCHHDRPAGTSRPVHPPGLAETPPSFALRSCAGVPSPALTVGCPDPAQAVSRHPLLRRVRWYDHPFSRVRQRPRLLGGAPMKTLRHIMRDGFLFTLQRDTTVADACRMMAAHNVGIVAVLDCERLCGVFSERDVTRRVVDRQLEPARTRLEEVMTSGLVVADADEDYQSAMNKMDQANIRHLPDAKAYTL